MSYSANHQNSKKMIDRGFFNNALQKSTSYKRDSSKKEKTKLVLNELNTKFDTHCFTNSSLNTNISIIKEVKNDLPIYNYRVKPIEKESLAKRFIKKKKTVYVPPSIINSKVISFQKQSNKRILEFPLFDDELIFKDINKSYLQDEYSDDGSESSDEKIYEGAVFLNKELEDSAKEVAKSLRKSQIQKLLSRKMRFKNEDNQ